MMLSKLGGLTLWVVLRLGELGGRLLALGSLGLFGICLLDSAFVPLPSGPDVALIALSTARPGFMLLYAAAATGGSAVGCLLLYSIARRGGRKVLSRVSPERRDRIENLLGRYDMLAVMVPALLPPPFPFKVFVLSAGAFKLKRGRFVAGIVIGRGVRFLVEGWLAIRFGEDAWHVLTQHGWKVLGLAGGASLLWSAVWAYRRREARKRAKIYEPIP